MASVKEHLHSFHVRASQHHLARAKFHKSMSAHFHKLAAMHKAAKSEMDEGGEAMDLFESAAGEHNAMADECVSMGEFHTDCAKCLSDGAEPAAKAAMSDSARGAALVPDNVSGITPEAPANIRPVPRYGAPNIERPGVPPEFEKMVAVETE
jgi:hypothetical protein